MKIVFLGVGEAFDENYPNTSILVSTKGTNLLLDCGYSVPVQIWKYNPDPNFLDAIYISHCHADHYFGIPAILVRMWEGKREKPLKVFCQKGFQKTIDDIIELAYPQFRSRFNYPIEVTEVSPGDKVKLNELNLEFAPIEHSLPGQAIKVSNGKRSVCYSGDGKFTPQAEMMYKQSDLVIQETYLLDESRVGHASIAQLIEMAKRIKLPLVAAIHLNRDFRRDNLDKIQRVISETKGTKILLPEPFDEYDFS